MSLHRRLILALSLLLIMLLASTMAVTIYNARQNLYLQLQVHAQDTATSLGLTISHAAQAEDLVQVSSMIDVIFDRGYYRTVIYRNVDGEEAIRKELPFVVEDVPQWFIELLPIEEPNGRAEVISGWYQLGSVEVVSHTGFAYRDLWRAFKDQLWLFLFTSVLCYGLLGLALQVLLRPLENLEAQADAITRQDFSKIYPIPRIPELRRVVLAMNRMREKLKQLFSHQVELISHLHHQLRTDPVTGLSNRQDFDERLTAMLKSDRKTSRGALMLLQIGDLQDINMQQGRQEGDAYLRIVTDCLKRNLVAFDEVLCSRHSGADFAVFIPAIDDVESQSLMVQLHAELQAAQWNGEGLQKVFLGVVYVDVFDGEWSTAQLLTAVDTALAHARTDDAGYHWQDHTNRPAPLLRTASEWREILEEGFAKHHFQYLYQPVWLWQGGQKTLLFDELLTQLVIDGEVCPAGEFVPVAQRLQMLPLFDHHVLANLLANKSLIPENLCINIASASVLDLNFVVTLGELLAANKDIAPRLVFELPATCLSHSQEAVREFAQLVKGYGASLSLHHFGQGTSEFAFLHSLPLDYLKIDRCFIQSIVDDRDAQFFVQSLVSIANSCDVTILAEGVETEEQWQQLLALGVQGGQGYWLGRPQAEPQLG